MNDLIPPIMDWQLKAACRPGNINTTIFYPVDCRLEDEGLIQSYNRARAVCYRCPVREECLEYAMTHHEKHGMWGGKSPLERRNLARYRRRDRSA